MPAHRSFAPFRLLPLALAVAAGLARADSGVGVDTWRANRLDPDAGSRIVPCDERGTSWLQPVPHRAPGGNLYDCPPATPVPDAHGDWQGYGILQLGLLGTGGDDRNALWNRYVDWQGGLVLGLLQFTAERADDGAYADVRASRLGDDDQYYQAVFGRAGSYKVQAFLRDLPNVLSDDARPIWNGVGSDRLTLPPGLVAAGSTPAEVAAASAGTPERRLSVRRDKQGLAYSVWLDPRWTAYANLTREHRRGERPFGGPFFFNYPFGNDGGILETVKPIDDATIAVEGGVRYAGPTWRVDLGYSGSFYRDRYTRYTYQMPFALHPVVAGAVSAPLATGQFATEPDNDYHRLQAAFTRRIAWNGELSLTASGGRMAQDDTLIAPIDCQGVFGIGLGGSLAPGPQNPYLYRCADWNTPRALPRRSADLRIDTTLLDGRIVLQPWSTLSLRGGLRFEREDYRGTWLALNPLTGQYGYVAENGAQGSVVPGESGIFDPLASPSSITRVRNLPLDMQTTQATLGADWKPGPHDTLGATLALQRYEPGHRERTRVDDSSVKLTWTNRALDPLVLRANYTRLHRGGDAYDADPYGFTYSTSLPGFVPPAGGIPAHTVDAMRKYDLSGRDEDKLDLVGTIALREDMTLAATLRGDFNTYDARIGRHRYDTFGLTLQWEWQPSPSTHASLWYGFDRSSLGLANVNEINDSGADPTLGGPTYPLSGRWWVDDRQRNHSAGATFARAFGRVRVDAAWNYLNARGATAFAYASPLALAWGDTVAGDGAGAGVFPPMAYRVDTLSASASYPLLESVSLRLFDIYERGRVDDWHYLGFDAGLVQDHRVYTDAGPRNWSANLVGLLVEIRL
jgi:hypothetical protein